MAMSHQNRLETLERYFRENDMSIGMITHPANVSYYTGFNSDPHERFMALVWHEKNEAFTLFVPELDKEMAQQASFVTNIVGILRKMRRRLGEKKHR